MTTLFQQPLSVLNLGLESFANNLRDAGGDVLHLQWQPAAFGDEEANWMLAKLMADTRVDAANDIALQRYLDAQPVLIGISTAQVRPSPGQTCVAQCKGRLPGRLCSKGGPTALSRPC